MKERLTDHIGSLLVKRPGEAFLNAGNLLSLLQQSQEFEERPRVIRGKKRAAPSPAPVQRKRFKKDPSVVSLLESPEVDDEQISVPVYLHTFILQFRHEAVEAGLGCDVEEHAARLVQWLDEAGNRGAELHEFDDISLKVDIVDGSKLVAFAHNDGSDLNLLYLPSMESDFSLSDHNMRIVDFQDPFLACHALEGIGRTKLSAKLSVVPLQPDQVDDKDVFPLQLHLVVTVSLMRPTIFQPIISNSKTQSAEVDEAQRRLLSYLFPQDSLAPESFHGNIDISLLYSILKPAPRLRPSLDKPVQPTDLVPTLLPFQLRSVAWMLHQENKELSEGGEVIPRNHSDSDLPLFWQRVNVAGGEQWFFNRVTGALSPDSPKDAHLPLGGILAEEPGLGKTLECIALILLNPAIGRNPTAVSWDPIARINVREIKVHFLSSLLLIHAQCS